MSISNEEQKTIEYYDRAASQWAAIGAGLQKPFSESEMLAFQHLLPNGRLLEIGSGPG